MALNTESATKDRYSSASQDREAALCCPVDYDASLLEIIPEPVLERDYGCGDPSRYCRPGDTVLDLGSGGGKICFMASQIVGPSGHVIGVDMTPDMLALAREFAPVVAERTGHANVEFHRGRIQDLALSLDALDAWLAEHPVTDANGVAALEAQTARLRTETPMIADGSVDLVVSNCVLNLVHDDAKTQLVSEIFRVLKVGGRVAISDIVSDEVPPAEMKNDAELWSGCISGAFQEQELVRIFEDAGFHAIELDKYDAEPWQTVQGIEFRSVTLTAQKGKAGPCKEGMEAVIYKGPWKQVLDDDGHVLRRGDRVAVCSKTYKILTSAPYAAQIIPVPPRTPIAEADKAEFDCSRTGLRHPQETKGAAFDLTTAAGDCCGPSDCC